MSMIMIVTFLATCAAMVLGVYWANYFLKLIPKDSKGGIKSIQDFHRGYMEFALALVACVLLAVATQYLFRFHFLSEIEFRIKNIAVTQHVLENIDYENAKLARENIATILENSTNLDEEPLYLEFLRAFFGDIPGAFLESGSPEVTLLETLMKENSTEVSTGSVHGEFSVLLNQLGISPSEAADIALIPYPDIPLWNIAEQRIQEPGSYLRQGIDDPSKVALWIQIFEYQNADVDNPLSFEEKTIRLQFLNDYIRHFNELFEDELSQAAMLVGPIQMALIFLLYLAVTVIAMRLTMARSEIIKQFVQSNPGKGKYTWRNYLEDIPYAPINFSIWAIPSIGFIGTVFGIKQSLGKADLVVAALGRSEQIMAVGEVTTLLSLAFDTTLVALLINVVVMSLFYATRAIEYRLLYH